MAKKKNSTARTAKKVAKVAKKNPKVFIILIIVVLVLAGLGIGGYFIWKSMNPSHSFKLNGTSPMYVALHTEYKEPGAVATYADKDISNEIKTTYLDKDKNVVTGITTEEESTFYVEYKIEHEKLKETLERKVIVSDVAGMSINFLELGNTYTGDSTFIKAGDTDILIDAGSIYSSSKTIGDFVDTYCTDGKLEYVIATHAHEDHIAGFVGTNDNPGIFERFEVETIIDFAQHNTTSKVYNNYVTKRDAEVAAGAKHYTALECVKEQNGAKKIYDLAPGITMEILDQRFYEETTSDENDYSVCTLFTQGTNHYLLTGDLEKDGEKSLVAKNTLPKVQLFKGAHHGSYTANTDELLSVIQPETVCICCCAGSTEYTTNPDNTFPAQAAINRLGKYTDKIYVTTLSIDYKEKTYTSMNGNILFYCASGTAYTVTGSNNNTILKDTEWFKKNRTWPTA